MRETRNVHDFADSQDGDVASAAIAKNLTLLPAILAAIGEVRQLLGERRKELLTVEEVAELTGRAPYTVRTWIKEKRIAAIRIPGTGPKGRLLIQREELQRLIASGLGAAVPNIAID